MSGVVLPLPEPPDEHLDELRVKLALARDELAEAGRVVERLRVDVGDEWWPPGPRDHTLARERIENNTAERRCELWADVVRELESRLRAAGGAP